MKTIAMVLAMLMVLTIMPLTEARTDRTQEEIWAQRLISHIHYNQNRLRNFCSEDKIAAEGYERKVCKGKDSGCVEFLKDAWNEWCSDVIAGMGIRNYDYDGIFSDQRKLMKEHSLPLLRNRHETAVTAGVATSTVERITENSDDRRDQPMKKGRIMVQ